MIRMLVGRGSKGGKARIEIVTPAGVKPFTFDKSKEQVAPCPAGYGLPHARRCRRGTEKAHIKPSNAESVQKQWQQEARLQLNSHQLVPLTAMVKCGAIAP